MNNDDIEKRIEERWRRTGKNAERGRIWVGLFLLIIGGLFLARESGVAFPSWFFSWPLLLIGLGLFSGIRHGFRGIGWLFPIAIGGIFLYDKISPEVNLRPYLWPILLIAAGLFIIFRPKGRHCRRGGGRDDNAFPQQETTTTFQNNTTQTENATISQNDVIDITAIFGGVKKNVLSKHFKGGDIVAVMGGAEINLSQADFKGRVMIDCFNMFGGTKLIVPPDWEVQSQIVSIFGGVEDKRLPASAPAPDKVIYLEGTCVFGGLEIKSY
jgi:predicted membrane protein